MLVLKSMGTGMSKGMSKRVHFLLDMLKSSCILECKSFRTTPQRDCDVASGSTLADQARALVQREPTTYPLRWIRIRSGRELTFNME